MLIIEVLEMDEKTKLDMYCRGLKPNIRLQVMLRAPSSLDEAQITALNVDNILNSNSAFEIERTQRSNFHHLTNGNYSTPMDLGNIGMNSNGTSQEQSNVVKKFNNSFKRLSIDEIMKLRQQNKCFKFQKVGHIARNCRIQNKN